MVPARGKGEFSQDEWRGGGGGWRRGSPCVTDKEKQRRTAKSEFPLYRKEYKAF